MRSVVKGNYIKGTGGIKHAIAHVRYLQLRGGQDRDSTLGKKRLFFSDTHKNISGTDVIAQLNKQREDGVVAFRLVLSPGLEGVDMQAYTKALMRELQSLKGQDLLYYATEHKNTDHTHNHLIIMGRDKHDRTVRITRKDYKELREAGDRYIERYHPYERFLDKDLHTLMRDGYKRDRGDQIYEWLLDDLKSPMSLEECEQQRINKSRFIKEVEINALPDSERIVRNKTVYTKFSTLQELLALDLSLRSGKVERLKKDQYQKMWSWIGNKKQFGDDYYERTVESDRLQRKFEEDLKESLRTNNSPPKSFNQYIFESRGRLLEWHEKYAIDTQRYQLQKELVYLDRSDREDPYRQNDPQRRYAPDRPYDQDRRYDPDRRRSLIDQLDWLDTLSRERCESQLKRPVIRRFKEQKKMDTQTESVRSDGNLALPERENRILAVQSQLQEQLRQAQQDQENLEKHLEQYQDLTSQTHDLEQQNLLNSLIYGPQHDDDAAATSHPHASASDSVSSESTSSDHPDFTSSVTVALPTESSPAAVPPDAGTVIQNHLDHDQHIREEQHERNTEVERHQTERDRTTERVRFDAENTFKRQKEWRRLQLLFDKDDSKYPESFTSRFQQLLDNLVHEFTHKHREHREPGEHQESTDHPTHPTHPSHPIHPIHPNHPQHPEHFLNIPLNTDRGNQTELPTTKRDAEHEHNNAPEHEHKNIPEHKHKNSRDDERER